MKSILIYESPAGKKTDLADCEKTILLALKHDDIRKKDLVSLTGYINAAESIVYYVAKTAKGIERKGSVQLD